MGRYYTGDIEGKFWFGVQESTDASFFGGNECEPNHIEYYFCKNDLPDIRKGLATCKKTLGDWAPKIDAYWKIHDAYNDEAMAKELGITTDKLRDILTWYARLELGTKIFNCVKKTGECSFDAEL